MFFYHNLTTIAEALSFHDATSFLVGTTILKRYQVTFNASNDIPVFAHRNYGTENQTYDSDPFDWPSMDELTNKQEKEEL